MLRVFASIVTVAALLAAAVPAVAAARCPDRPGRVLARTATVEVLSQPAKHGYRRVVACLRGAARPVPLGLTNDDEASTNAIQRVTIAGHFVAFARSFTDGKYTDSDTVAVYDVRARRAVSEDPAGAQVDAEDELGAVTDLVLRPNGHVAWIVERIGPAQLRSRQVWKRDGGGLALVVDDATIVAGSLAASATDLYWRGGSGAAFAPFA